MAEVRSITISASRKVSANYNVREAALSITLELADGDEPKALAAVWMGRLQCAIDQAVGDFGPTSFGRRNAEKALQPKVEITTDSH